MLAQKLAKAALEKLFPRPMSHIHEVNCVRVCLRVLFV